MKLSKIKTYESNSSRADEFVKAFIQNIEWEDYINEMDILESITKEEVVEVANKYYNDNYVLVRKNLGEDKSVIKVTKPAITPVEVNQRCSIRLLESHH